MQRRERLLGRGVGEGFGGDFEEGLGDGLVDGGIWVLQCGFKGGHHKVKTEFEVTEDPGGRGPDTTNWVGEVLNQQRHKRGGVGLENGGDVKGIETDDGFPVRQCLLQARYAILSNEGQGGQHLPPGVGGSGSLQPLGKHRDCLLAQGAECSEGIVCKFRMFGALVSQGKDAIEGTGKVIEHLAKFLPPGWLFVGAPCQEVWHGVGPDTADGLATLDLSLRVLDLLLVVLRVHWPNGDGGRMGKGLAIGFDPVAQGVPAVTGLARAGDDCVKHSNEQPEREQDQNLPALCHGGEYHGVGFRWKAETMTQFLPF